MKTTYDPHNIFAKIIRGDIPANRIYEDDVVLAIHDAFPKTKIHALVLPKGPYISSREFHETATDRELTGYYRGIAKTLEALGLTHGEGYRLISNSGDSSGQEVFHYHTHILAGEPLKMMYPDE